MKSYLALIIIDLKLAMRNKAVLFFAYLFPIGFFIVFAEMMDAGRGGMISYVVSMVLVLGILGNGLFGAGMRAVQERENNILRRYKVAPITPTPILVASMVTGWAVYLPAVLMILAIAHFYYGMPMPVRILSLFAIASIGIITFRSIGMILASVVNSMQESNILIQLLYMPMLFLSGATFPISSLPQWAQVFSQFLPASYLVTGFQGIFLRNETIIQNVIPVLALLTTLCLATFVSSQLFRWEKEEKIRPAAKLWVLAVLAPFILLGVYQIYSQDHLRKSQVLWRDVRRSENLLITGARIFVGNGKVIPSGAVLVQNGKIVRVSEGPMPDSKSIQAEVIEASGKTLLPGLIDARVHLSVSGDPSKTDGPPAGDPEIERELAAYLYCGITGVKSDGDGLNTMLGLRNRISIGELLAAELYVFSPTFIAKDGSGNQFLGKLTGPIKTMAEKQLFRIPGTPGQAAEQVRDLQESGVNGIQASMVRMSDGISFQVLSPEILKAISSEARKRKLPVLIHVSDNNGIAEAIHAGASAIEMQYPEEISKENLDRLARQKIFYIPAVHSRDAMLNIATGNGSKVLERPLVQEVGPRELLEKLTRQLEVENGSSSQSELAALRSALEQSKSDLRKAAQTGVILVTGSNAGSAFVLHGPTIQREMQIWVLAGIPASLALQAATYNAASFLGVGNRVGLIQNGYDANLLLVEGDPLQDITATERISMVVYQGEVVNRMELQKAIQKTNP